MMGIITNIGVSHIEHLGSRENILKAKLELADALPDGATLLLCDDNDLLHTVDIPRLHVVRYGLNSPRAEIKATIVSATPLSTNFMLHAEGQSWRATIPGTGEHLVLNALAAFGAGRAMGIPAETAIEALKNYTPSGQRQRWWSMRALPWWRTATMPVPIPCGRPSRHWGVSPVTAVASL